MLRSFTTARNLVRRAPVRRLLCACALLVALTASTPAQNMINGTNGRDMLQGTGGRDQVFSSAPGALGADGKRDTIDVSGDPQNVDVVEIGPEDFVRCDPNDFIFIWNANGGALWQGNGAQYAANRNFALWVRWAIKQLIAQFTQYTYVEAIPIVFAAIGLDPEDPELEWLVECLIWWEIEGVPEEEPPPLD